MEKSLEGSFFFSCSTCAAKSPSVAAFGTRASSNANEFKTSLRELVPVLHPPTKSVGKPAISTMRKICFLTIKLLDHLDYMLVPFLSKVGKLSKNSREMAFRPPPGNRL